MNKCLKKILVILIVFVCSFLTVYYLGFINNCFDPLNSYGFSKAIMMGQVPYRDFNTVTTPLYAFYQAIFLEHKKRVANYDNSFSIRHAEFISASLQYIDSESSSE